MNRPASYRLLKELAINLSSLGIPVSFCAGFLVGSGQWYYGVLAMVIYILMDNLASRLWFTCLEHLTRKK